MIDMGIDCYMYWKGITEEEHQKQITGYSIDAGDVGYLRVAYNEWMLVEHDLFCKIFPKRIMESKKENGESYDFKRNYKRVRKMLVEYVQQNMDNNFEQSVTWANSVLQFFYLGLEKQEQKLRPTIRISG